MMKLGITGYPLLYTRSPKIHESFLKQSRRVGSYTVLPFDPTSGKKKFFNFLDSLREDGFTGINITIPHKEWAFEYAAKNGTEAKGFDGGCASAVKAANTLIFSKRGVSAANTDAGGLWDDVQVWLERRKKRNHPIEVFIVGTGGAARGAIAGILRKHAATKKITSVTIWGRDRTKIKTLRNLLPRQFYRATAPDEGKKITLVLWCLSPVNANEAKSIWRVLFKNTQRFQPFLYDLNYGERARSTEKLVPKSKRREGSAMLRLQAKRSFDLWMKAAKRT